ncbi:MAG: alcohol dehydrogenase, propanol-preferring [Miltoncostaeaceae bacterium]|jgi:propanol-preferring alcohol dehydrogenase|nr:alcohol dehydrogenase, propanol-preferring [Miltoncostaeaceae bacterium]
MLLQRPAPVASGPLQPVELPDPEPADDEIVLEVAACAVCRTDLQICEGDVVPRRLPIVLGHQAVGRVVAVGAAASGWRLGERAGVGWLGGTCGVCRFCRSQRENLCERAAFTGWDRNGGYAERIAVRADFALRLPERMTDAQAAPLLCGGVIGYRSLRVSGIAPGGRLGLYGFGASALLTIQVALHWGCEVYVATRSRAERERALGLGAVWAGGADESPPRPLDAAITFAPVGEVVLAALGALDRGGAVAVNAIHIDRIPEFPYERLWWERSLRSVANFTRRDAREFLDLAAAIPIRTEIDERPLQAANETLADLSAGRVRGAAVLVP